MLQDRLISVSGIGYSSWSLVCQRRMLITVRMGKCRVTRDKEIHRSGMNSVEGEVAQRCQSDLELRTPEVDRALVVN